MHFRFFNPSVKLRRSHEAVRKLIHENAVFDSALLMMNALATVVACYGLLEDSNAVVIGAMVIATLLGPISGIALALVVGDNRLLRNAMIAEAIGIFVVLGIALLIGAIHRDVPLTREILSRTKPTLFDLMIALGGGAAGAYATATPRSSAGLVGVAIATALVPPLATCGLCLGRGETQLAYGAFILFTTNLVAIQFGSSVVLWACGFNKLTFRSEPGHNVLIRNAFSLGTLLVLGLVLALHFGMTLTTQLFERETRLRLIHALNAYPNAELTDLRFQQTSDTVVVIAEIMSKTAFGPEQVAALEKELSPPPGANLELVIHSVLSRRACARDISTTHHTPAKSNGRAKAGEPSHLCRNLEAELEPGFGSWPTYLMALAALRRSSVEWRSR